MRIGLMDQDRTRFPNLALMKLSAHFKAHGHDVGWFAPLLKFDEVYSSKVFTFSGDDLMTPIDATKGGSGYSLVAKLPEEVEHVCPDYSLYPNIMSSYGFLTRGCPRRCQHCIVWKKEGNIQAHAEVEEFLRHKQVVLMDNNVLAHPHGLQQIEKLVALRVAVDFNQGLDARLVTPPVARLLARLRWIRFVRFACDNSEMKRHIKRAVKLLRESGCSNKIMAYVLVTDDIEDALDRVKFLAALGVDPFAQAFRGRDNKAPSMESSHFARWVNHKAIFKSVPWNEYSTKGAPKCDTLQQSLSF